MQLNETICAISSPPGQGAVAIVRLSGDSAFEIGNKLIEFPDNKEKSASTIAANSIRFCKIKDGDMLIDEGMAAFFHAPHSYTSEDTIEIYCHGSQYIQQRILETLIKNGARLAKPGEFTLRAFLNGKLDLSQAEGVADLIASGSEAAHRLAINQIKGGFSEEIKMLRDELLHFVTLIELELDFSEEDVEFADREQLYNLIDKIERKLRKLIRSFSYGNAIKNGIPVAIVGKTNVGKSTLLNKLLHEEKAIVSEIAGTTRDFIEDTISLEGITFRFIDTAGIRKTSNEIETIGIERALKKLREAQIVLVMIDANDNQEEIEKSLEFIKAESHINKHILFIINKIDSVINPDLLLHDIKSKINIKGDYYTISAKFGTNIQQLENKLIEIAKQDSPPDSSVIVTNARHFEALQKSHESILRVIEGLDNKLSGDLLSMDIREVLHYLGEITGEITNDEILGNIFKNFCIGK